MITTRQLPMPRLRGTATCGPWTALLIDDVNGREPALPWQPADIDRVLTTLDHLARLVQHADHRAGSWPRVKNLIKRTKNRTIG